MSACSNAKDVKHFAGKNHLLLFAKQYNICTTFMEYRVNSFSDGNDDMLANLKKYMY